VYDPFRKPITPRISNQKTSALSAASSFIFWSHPPRIQSKLDLFAKGRKTPKRRDPGERREDENAKYESCFFSFLKKMLCGLRVLCGDIFLSSEGVENFLIPCATKKPFRIRADRLFAWEGFSSLH
jgi:hypothetical protein